MTINTAADLSKTASNNVDFLGQDASGGGNASNIDGVRQSLGAIIARWYDDLGAVMTVGGTGNAITVTSNSTYQALRTGMVIGFKAGAANTGAATLNLDSKGAKAIRRQGDSALSSGDIVQNGVYLLRYDEAYNSAAGAWVLLNPTVGASTDLGTLINALNAKSAPITADLLAIVDTADSNAGKKSTIAQVLGATVASIRSLAVVAGDLLYGSAGNTISRLAKGTNGQVLTLASGLPSWSDLPSSSSGQPVPTSSTYAVDTLALCYVNTGAANNGGTISGSALRLLCFSTGGGTELGATQSGTWTNVSGVTLNSSSTPRSGYFVRTA